MNPVSIPSKYENVESMFKACTGYVKPNSRDEITAKQGKRSVRHIKHEQARVGQII